MYERIEIKAAFSLIIIVVIGLACGNMVEQTCGTGVKASLLKSMLNAPNDEAFNRALSDHGSVTQDELPCILSAIEGYGATRRQNAAKLLPLVGGDRDAIIKAEKEVVSRTEDLFVWAKILESILRRDPKLTFGDSKSGRHDMIQRALNEDDSFIQSVGLKAGIAANYPGIEKELRKRLDSMDPKLLAIALDALSTEKAIAEQDRLFEMLEEYETGTKYKDSGFKINVFTPLLNALIRTGDTAAYEAVRKALEKGYSNPRLVRGTRDEFRQFRNTAAVIRPDSHIVKFCYYLIEQDSILKSSAIDILSTQVIQGFQSPSSKLVRVCVNTIEAGNPDTTDWRKHRDDKPEQTVCEKFFGYLEFGKQNSEKGDGKRKLGTDAVEYGRKWLSEND